MLEWRRRDENTEADPLTNNDFSLFDMSRRIKIDVNHMFPFLLELTKFEAEFREQLEDNRSLKRPPLLSPVRTGSRNVKSRRHGAESRESLEGDEFYLRRPRLNGGNLQSRHSR